MLTRARKMLYRAQGHVETRLGGARFRGDPWHSKFWHKAAAGRWEPETFEVLRAHLDPDRDYLDIGAWIGPTVMFAARRARHVWAFEPDPAAFRALSWNLELNRLDNVSALPAALAATAGIARMAGFRGEPGDSTTSLLNPGGTGGCDVVTLGWDDFAGAVDLSAVSLVKIDIEGAEFELVPRLCDWLRATRPALYLSTHAPLLPEAARAERMAMLADALGFYGRWRDARMNEIAPAALSEADALTGFRTFLLSD